MVEIKGLEKSFGRLKVLKGVDATVASGKITAILGPNGSGKSTLIKCILGIVIPGRGTIQANGVDIKNNWAYRHQIGYMPQIARFPENIKVKETIRMIQDIRESDRDPQAIIDLFGLNDFMDRKLKNLSGGTRQKVNLVLSFMFDPAILILDEPTAGLDPISSVHLKELLFRERNNNKTIIFTTHILSEVEEIADDIVFLLDGVIYYHGSPKELMAEHGEPNLEKAIAAMLRRYQAQNASAHV